MIRNANQEDVVRWFPQPGWRVAAIIAVVTGGVGCFLGDEGAKDSNAETRGANGAAESAQSRPTSHGEMDDQESGEVEASSKEGKTGRPSAQTVVQQLSGRVPLPEAFYDFNDCNDLGRDRMGKHPGQVEGSVGCAPGALGHAARFGDGAAFDRDKPQPRIVVPSLKSFSPGRTITVSAWVKVVPRAGGGPGGGPVVHKSDLVGLNAGGQRINFVPVLASSQEVYSAGVLAPFWKYPAVADEVIPLYRGTTVSHHGYVYPADPSIDEIRANWPADALERAGWVHVAGVYDGHWERIYYNGLIAGTRRMTQSAGAARPLGRPSNGAGPLIIGNHDRSYWGYDELFSGAIDQVQVYDEALDEEQVAMISNRFCHNNYSWPDASHDFHATWWTRPDLRAPSYEGCVPTVKAKGGAFTPVATYFQNPYGYPGHCEDADALDVGWFYNWAATPWSELGQWHSRVMCRARRQYVPQLWFPTNPSDAGAAADFRDRAKAALRAAVGDGYLLGSNEPDMKPSGPVPSDFGADYWRILEEEARGYPSVTLVSPATSQHAPGMRLGDFTVPEGKEWLWKMVATYKSRRGHKPRFDAIAIHIYGYDLNAMKGYILEQRQRADAAGYAGVPFWITEYNGCYGTDRPYEIMRDLTAWFEATPWITRWSWFNNRPDPNPDTLSMCLQFDGSTHNFTSTGRWYRDEIWTAASAEAEASSESASAPTP